MTDKIDEALDRIAQAKLMLDEAEQLLMAMPEPEPGGVT